jgi:hypothetical protein
MSKSFYIVCDKKSAGFIIVFHESLIATCHQQFDAVAKANSDKKE